MESNNVLILERQETLSNIFSLILTKKNLQETYKLVKRSSFNGAVDAIKKTKFQVILLDHDFVAREGVKLLAEIHNHSGGARCVLISDSVEDNTLKDKLAEGSLSLLNRSFQDEELLSLMEAPPRISNNESLCKVFEEIDEYPCEAVFIDDDFTIGYANKHFRDVHGECIGNQCFRVMGVSNRKCTGCPAIIVFEKKTEKSIIRKFTNENGDQKEIKECIRPNLTSDDRVSGYILTFSDAMSADIMPEPVLQHLAKIQSLEEQNLITFALDNESRIIYADHNFVTLCETELSSMLGKSVTTYLHSYLVEYLAKEEKDFVSFIKASRSDHISIDFVTRKKKQRLTLICEFRKSADMSLMGWEILVIARDARKEKLLTRLIEFLEESSRQLLSGNFDMFVTLDQNKNIKSINQSCEKKLGCKKSQLLGKSIQTILADERDIDTLHKALEQVSALHMVYNLRIDFKCNNHLVPTLVNIRSVQDRFNNDIGYAIVMRDIERDLMMEATLPRIERMQALGELAATTAHQINNYIDGITKGIALLEMDSMLFRISDKNRAEFTEHIGMIRERTSRLAALTRHLTNYARSQQAPVISLGDVNSVIRDVVELVRDKIKAKTAVIRTSLSKNISPLYFSPIHLEQAIINIVMNAIDAVPEREGKILISTSLKDSWVCITVRDNGCGIPDDVKPDIFKAFKTTKPLGVGTGLGLKLAKDIVNSLNGKIDVESNVGSGTSFVVSLPLRKAGS